jgi:hypothetical protein
MYIFTIPYPDRNLDPRRTIAVRQIHASGNDGGRKRSHPHGVGGPLADRVPITMAAPLRSAPIKKLYIAVGDNATRANSQTLGNRLGKILRINFDGTIPSDNPSSPQWAQTRRSGPSACVTPLALRFNPALYVGSSTMLARTTYEEDQCGA